MSRVQEIGNHLLWLLGHLLFTTILNLALFGGYHAYQWYQMTQPLSIDLSQLSNEEINQLNKEMFQEQQARK